MIKNSALKIFSAYSDRDFPPEYVYRFDEQIDID